MDVQRPAPAGPGPDDKKDDELFNSPTTICISRDQKLYFAAKVSNRYIIRMISDNVVSDVAGYTGLYSYPFLHEKASFLGLRGICISNNGKIYISETENDRIRMISNGTESTTAGFLKGFKDGNAGTAQFNKPAGLCICPDGSILVSDAENHRIRMISKGVVSTFAGSGEAGYEDGSAAQAKFKSPMGICMSMDGTIYVTDIEDHSIRSIEDGIVSNHAGCGTAGYEDGEAGTAMFNKPMAICISDLNVLYVADYENNRIRTISDGIVSTFAGCGKAGIRDGKAEDAMFHGPSGICVSRDGKIYVSDYGNNRIRMISNGKVFTITSAGPQVINIPHGISFSEKGDLLMTTKRQSRITMIANPSDLSSAYFRIHLLNQSKSLSDMTLTINNHQYHLHSTVVHSLCPLIIKHKSIIEKAKISHESLQTMFEMIYSNNTKKIRKERDQYQMTDLTQLAELIWLFESFEIKNESFLTTCIKQLHTEMEFYLFLSKVATLNMAQFRHYEICR